MAFKNYVLDGGTQITIYKRRTNHNLRLSITADGKVKVTIPLWAAYGAGLKFAQSREGWIRLQLKPATQLQEGQQIGKAHRLRFIRDSSLTKPASRIGGGEVIIKYPSTLSPGSPTVQKIAQTAAIRALRKQAEGLLPQRLATLSSQHNFSYKSVAVKQLKSRWGSCDQDTNITLNLFLMQLPWDAIDYVLLHELTHTRVMRHGPDFWSEMKTVLPGVQSVRKTMRSYRPVLDGSLEPSMA